MISLFKPTIYVPNIYEINYEKLKEKKIKLICFDLDNTLDKPDEITNFIDYKLKKKLKEIEEDFEVIIVSNNLIPKRVPSFADQVGLKYIEGMRKPFLKNYKDNEIIKKYDKKEIIFVGDKIVTDILGANRFGSKSILVDPLYPKSRKWYAFLMHLIDITVEKITKTKRKNYFNNLEGN